MADPRLTAAPAGTTASGVLYVASHGRYVVEAVLSAASVRRFHRDLPILLFTGEPGHPLLDPAVFTEVRPWSFAGNSPKPWMDVLRARVRALRASPFVKTLHLDADTRLCRPALDRAIALLDAVEIAMVEAAPDASLDRRVYGRPLFNCGLLFCRRTPGVEGLLREWEQLFDQQLAASSAPEPPSVPYLAHVGDEAMRRRLLASDQIALVQLFGPETNPRGLVFASLPEHWNHRGCAGTRVLAEPLVVDHRPDLRRRLREDLALLACERVAEGRLDAAATLYSFVIAEFFGGAPPVDAEAPTGAAAAGRDPLAPGLRSAVGVHLALGQQAEAQAVAAALR